MTRTNSMNTLRDQIDAQTSRALFMSIHARLEQIDRCYPEVGSVERINQLSDVIHLIHVFGWDIDDFRI
jgi:hypothetical protein